MNPVVLSVEDLQRVVQALIWGELKRLRRASDLSGERRSMAAGASIRQDPVAATDDEVARLSRRVAAFFSLDPRLETDLAGLETIGQWAWFVDAHWSPRRDTITLFTSGSTGEPKAVPRSFRSLEQDAHFLASLVQGAKRLVTMVPPHHIYGFLFGVLVPRVLGVRSLDCRFQSPLSVAHRLEPGDAVVSIPLFWKLFASTVPRFPPAIVGITSSAPCPADVFGALSFAGLSRLCEIHGSSECGAMGIRYHPDDPLTLAPFWKRTGSNTFVRTAPGADDSPPYEFQDELDWVDERRYRVKKRLDHAVKVGGVNVFPSRVEQVLLRHELVERCAVRLMRPEEGERLKAFVVLVPHATPGQGAERSIRDFLAKELTHLEQPRSITFGEALPLNDMGKLADWPTRPVTDEEGPAPLDRAAAVERLRSEAYGVEPGQPFEVGRFEPRDAWAVARCFFAVHGPDFPFEMYYVPDRLVEANRRRSIRSVVARTARGDVVGHGALFRSSAPHPGVHELGQPVILPEYRSSGVESELNRFILDTLAGENDVDVIFNETDCRLAPGPWLDDVAGFAESAIEIGLMPPGRPEGEGASADRVSDVIRFRTVRDRRHTLFFPARYSRALEYLMNGMNLDRRCEASTAGVPGDLFTRLATQFFDFAQVSRCGVVSLGRDFREVIDAFERQSWERGMQVVQVFVNLGEPWCAHGVDHLREQGFFLGGFLPRWFDSDGLLMQKLARTPASDTVETPSRRAARIAALVAEDVTSGS